MDERPPTRRTGVDAQIADEAAEWLLRLEEDDSPTCLSGFSAWLENSPRHMDEFLLITAASRSMRELGLAGEIGVDETVGLELPNVVPITRAVSSVEGISIGRSEFASESVPGGRRWSLGWVAGLAAMVTAVALLGWQWPLVDSLFAETYTTAIGEQRSFQLEDGSILHLNTQSRVQVHFVEHARDIKLVEGEALFEVAHDPNRPFRVNAGSAVIQAVGTEFNVYRRSQEIRVTVVEGKVEIETARAPVTAEAPASAPLLKAGEEAAIESSGQVVRRAAPDIAAAVAWRQHRLVFRAERLDDIAREFNRYNRMTIRIEDPTVAEQRVSGTFNSNDPNAFLRFLEEDPAFALAIERSHGSVVVRARGDSNL